MDDPCECGIEPLGSISHGVREFKPAGKRSLGRARHRWENNIRMNLKEIDISTWNWVYSVQDRDYWRVLVKAQGSIN